MNKRKHLQTIRLIVQAVFFAITNGYVQGYLQGKIYKGKTKTVCVPGLNCYSCPGALNACPIGALQAVLNSRQFSWSCYVLGILMVIGAGIGRLVCGWLCPFGLVQDLLYKIPVFKKKKNLPGHRYLTKLKFVILAVFVVILSALVKDITGLGKPWFCEYICPSGTLLGGIPLVILNPGLRAAIGFRFLWKVFVLLFIILLAIGYYRPFCKYLCPLGAIYGLCNPISLYRYHVDQDRCTSCGACQKACGMDIKVWETPNSIECIRCGKCRTACPNHAIVSSVDRIKNSSSSVDSVKSDDIQTQDRIVVYPDLASTDQVWDFVNSIIKRNNISEKTGMAIRISVDEIYSNIIHYSYATQTEILCRFDEQRLCLIFRDNGEAFDPTRVCQSDVLSQIEEGEPGRLGIFMVRKSADSMSYVYENQQNVLQLEFDCRKNE